MKLELELTEEGDVRSALAAALDGRKIDLSSAQPGPHPLQAVAVAGRQISASLADVLDGIDSLGPVGGPSKDGEIDVVDKYRRLVYDATELFDVYQQLIPERLKGRGNDKAVKEYKQTIKRLRDPWALLCNRMKHENAQLSLRKAASKVSISEAHGYALLRYKDSRALLLDEQVHQKPERSASFIRKLHELLHSLLRADLNAAKLVSGLPDDPSVQPLKSSVTFRYGDQLRRLLGYPLLVLSYEPATFDGVEVASPRTVLLTRKAAAKLIEPSHRTTTLRGDGMTDIFSFA